MTTECLNLQFMNSSEWWLCDRFRKRNGQPLLVLGTEEQIGLVIEVTNQNGEDAHQARMNIVLPDEVEYRRIELMSGNVSQYNMVTQIK